MEFCTLALSDYCFPVSQRKHITTYIQQAILVYSENVASAVSKGKGVHGLNPSLQYFFSAPSKVIKMPFNKFLLGIVKFFFVKSPKKNPRYNPECSQS